MKIILNSFQILSFQSLLFVIITTANFPLLVHAEIPLFTLELTPSMDLIYHPVSTNSKEAQHNFDQGLTHIFAFNHDLAFRKFEKASQIDPNLAMAYWGMALALGQNINMDVTPENELRAYDLSQKALKLISSASESEQAYIKALKTRYTNVPGADLISLRYIYREAMKKVTEKYSEDLDAATLYAESILDLDPWKYWTWDGKPKDGTLEATHVLSSVLKRNPYHVGANHYSIHIWEGSQTPERALLSAERLTALLPGSGHLLHMPSHIFLLVGDYEKAIQTSLKAIEVDKRYIAENEKDEFRDAHHYLAHNYYVLIRSYMLHEDYDNAIRTAMEQNHYLRPYFESKPDISQFSIIPLEVYLYFHKWNEILQFKLPRTQSPYADAYWHFCRSLAYLKMGDFESAQKEKVAMNQIKPYITDNELISGSPSTKVFYVAELVLNAAFNETQNQQAEVIENLSKAVDAQDRLEYNEPPSWYYPIRAQLGKAFLKQKRYSEANHVFKTGLKQLQRNGRLLLGLTLSLKGQNRDWDAYWAQREAAAALGTHSLTIDDL
ncbi:MAG: hypothetical protein H0T62_01950 [Parachlamydiaceae bacterium]|nr:hypothetical protein [Parachlamydiaceae bacterium]